MDDLALRYNDKASVRPSPQFPFALDSLLGMAHFLLVPTQVFQLRLRQCLPTIALSMLARSNAVMLAMCLNNCVYCFEPK